MELYRKKVNVTAKPPSGSDERYEDMKYNPSKRPKNVYLNNIMKKNQSQTPNEPINESQARKNIPSVRSSMEDIFSDENNKKKQ